MIPLLLDGQEFFLCNRLVWLAVLAVPLTFFVFVTVNPEARELDTAVEGRVWFALSLAAAYVFLAVATWAFFYVLRGRGAHDPAFERPPDRTICDRACCRHIFDQGPAVTC